MECVASLSWHVHNKQVEHLTGYQQDEHEDEENEDEAQAEEKELEQEQEGERETVKQQMNFRPRCQRRHIS